MTLSFLVLLLLVSPSYGQEKLRSEKFFRAGKPCRRRKRDGKQIEQTRRGNRENPFFRRFRSQGNAA